MAGLPSIPLYEELVERIQRLPSIGRKSAERIAYSIIEMSDEDVKKLINSISDAHTKIHRCSVCGNYTDKDICSICDDPKRDRSIICVVARPKDIISFERGRVLNCVYHVLHGLLSPLEGTTPEMLTIDRLVNRVKNGNGAVKEIIMATDPSVTGEATAMYVSKMLKPLGVKVTRLGYGISVGSDLQYADELTLMHSLECRNEL